MANRSTYGLHANEINIIRCSCLWYVTPGNWKLKMNSTHTNHSHPSIVCHQDQQTQPIIFLPCLLTFSSPFPFPSSRVLVGGVYGKEARGKASSTYKRETDRHALDASPSEHSNIWLVRRPQCRPPAGFHVHDYRTLIRLKSNSPTIINACEVNEGKGRIKKSLDITWDPYVKRSVFQQPCLMPAIMSPYPLSTMFPLSLSLYPFPIFQSASSLFIFFPSYLLIHTTISLPQNNNSFQLHHHLHITQRQSPLPTLISSNHTPRNPLRQD